MESFVNWLYATHASGVIRDVGWIVPTVQSVHILAIAVVIGSVLVTDLRLAGVIATDEPPHAIVRRYLPWMTCGVMVLLATGLVMLVGEPERTLPNPVFWAKMALLLLGLVLTALFRRPLLDRQYSLDHAGWRGAAKPLAWLSLAVWIGVVCCGRWIAYSM